MEQGKAVSMSWKMSAGGHYSKTVKFGAKMEKQAKEEGRATGPHHLRSFPAQESNKFQDLVDRSWVLSMPVFSRCVLVMRAIAQIQRGHKRYGHFYTGRLTNYESKHKHWHAGCPRAVYRDSKSTVHVFQNFTHKSMLLTIFCNRVLTHGDLEITYMFTKLKLRESFLSACRKSLDLATTKAAQYACVMTSIFNITRCPIGRS